MTYRRLAALKTAAGFRAHAAAPGVAHHLDETLAPPPRLPHRAAFRYMVRKHSP